MLFWVKQTKSQKEEKPAGQEKQNHPPPPSPGLNLPLNITLGVSQINDQSIRLLLDLIVLLINENLIRYS